MFDFGSGLSEEISRYKTPSEPAFYYPAIFISDTHLGKDVARADMLVEFLSHVSCDLLVINGDGIDGWYLEGHERREFPEMHARALDAINAMAAAGTRVVYIAGNHDEKLRGIWDRHDHRVEPPVLTVSSKKRRIFNRPYSFKTPCRAEPITIEIRKGLKYTDRRGRCLLVIHGDQFDTRALKTPFGKVVSKYVGDPIYDKLVKANSAAARFQKKFLPAHSRFRHFSIAKYLKGKTKKLIGIIESFEKAVAKTARSVKFDGAICGHIHHAEIWERDGAFYANSGDWVESCTALVHDDAGEWSIINWAEERLSLGLCELPCEAKENFNAALRPVTEKQLRWVHRLWPGRKVKNRGCEQVSMNVPQTRKTMESADKGELVA